MSTHSTIKKPIISIITICFNAEKHLEQTINSVLAQDYHHIEYIVIDGASTDSTLQIIAKYKNNIDYFISEPDTGISNAMNKGIKASTGDYLLFLHADDYLLTKNIITEATSKISATNKLVDIHAFSIYFGSPEKSLTLCHSSTFHLWLNFKDNIFHQGTLCSSNAFKKIGLFDESFKIAMDYDWFLRAHKQKLNFLTHKIPITVMRDTGISSQRSWFEVKKRLKEEQNVHKKNRPNMGLKLAYLFWWMIYPKYKQLTCQFKC